MSDRLRLAVVGLGSWARTGHLPVYGGARLRPHVEVVGLCSRSLRKAQSWAADIPSAEGFGDFETMLRRSAPDVVAVTTPDHLHTSFVLAALEAGCHVLVEKPLATSLTECRAILEAADQAERRVIVLYHKRADPLWAEAARRVGSGAYGALQMGWAAIQNPSTVPAGGYFKSDLASHTDPNWFLGSHFYDLLRFITGLDPEQVSARRYHGRLTHLGVSTADAFKADFVFTGGASLSVLTSWNLPASTPTLTKQTMLLHFVDGELELDGSRRGFLEEGPDRHAYVNPYFLRDTSAGPAGYGAGFLEEATLSLLDSGRETGLALPALEDAWWASAMAAAVAEASTSATIARIESPPTTTKIQAP